MKRLAIVLAAFLISVSSFAQFGIVAGLTSSFASVKEALDNYKSVNQFHAGVLYKFQLGSKCWAIQPALVYNVKGISGDISQTSVNLRTGYLELPVQVQAGANILDVLRVYGIAEPFIGYALSNRASGEWASTDTWDFVKNRFECGIGLGLGVEVIKHVQVNVRYFWNFGTIYGLDIQQISINNNSCNGIIASAAFLF